MALFGKSDKSIPLLTAFYQICVDMKNPVGGELDVLMQRTFADQPHTYALWSQNRGAEFEPEKQLREIARHHAQIVGFMNTCVDGPGLSPEWGDDQAWLRTAQTVYGFNDLIKEKLTVPQFEGVGPGRSFVLHYWPADKQLVDSFPVLHGPNDGALFTAVVLTDLIKAAQNNTLTRCQECRGVFSASRKNVRYCSKRCSNRVLNRQRQKGVYNAQITA